MLIYPLKTVIFHSYVRLPEGSWLVYFMENPIVNMNDLGLALFQAPHLSWERTYPKTMVQKLIQVHKPGAKNHSPIPRFVKLGIPQQYDSDDVK